MNKYTFVDNRLIYTPYNHACGIKSKGFSYDTAIRLIIFDNPKVIYIRINDLSIYQGLEYKKIQYTFNKNLSKCEQYLKEKYPYHKLVDSYSISKLSEQLQKEILNT